MSSNKIAIVGAGAMGIVTGYHLQHAGVETILIVRPGRGAEVPSRFDLYSYDDGNLHDYSGFRVTDNVEELTPEQLDFVILTLDGAALVSGEGTALLEALGAALHGRSTTVIVGSLGVGAREFAAVKMGLADEQVIDGLFAMLAHQTRGADFPFHSPTDSEKLARSQFAFRHLNEGGFLVAAQEGSRSQRFVDVYEKSGLAKCFIIPPQQFAMMTRSSFPVFIAAEILGWPNADVFTSDTDVWPLAVEAVRAIQGLEAHGPAGQKAASELTTESLAASLRKSEAAALPLDYPAFNAFHHGRKVKAADIAILNACIAQGEREGRSMDAVTTLLSRLT